MGALTAACKKKKDTEETPAPTPTAPVKAISVKVNGTEKSCNGRYSGSKSGGSRSSYFYLDGFNEQMYFGCGALPAATTYTLVKYGEPSLIYIKNNTYYRAVNGTITITGIDTSGSGVINKLSATFSFQTDTTSGVSFTISEGSINQK